MNPRLKSILGKLELVDFSGKQAKADAPKGQPRATPTTTTATKATTTAATAEVTTHAVEPSAEAAAVFDKIMSQGTTPELARAFIEMWEKMNFIPLDNRLQAVQVALGDHFPNTSATAIRQALEGLLAELQTKCGAILSGFQKQADEKCRKSADRQIAIAEELKGIEAQIEKLRQSAENLNREIAVIDAELEQLRVAKEKANASCRAALAPRELAINRVLAVLPVVK